MSRRHILIGDDRCCTPALCCKVADDAICLSQLWFDAGLFSKENLNGVNTEGDSKLLQNIRQRGTSIVVVDKQIWYGQNICLTNRYPPCPMFWWGSFFSHTFVQTWLNRKFPPPPTFHHTLPFPSQNINNLHRGLTSGCFINNAYCHWSINTELTLKCKSVFRMHKYFPESFH